MKTMLCAASKHARRVIPGQGPKTRFRILIDSIGSGTYAQMHEVIIRNSRGTNVLGQGTIATHSSSYDSNSFGANRLIGGAGPADQSRWIAQENQQNGSWVAFQIPVAEEAVTLEIGSYDFNVQRLPKDFKFQVSDDGIIWTTVKQFTNQINWGNPETRVFSLQ